MNHDWCWGSPHTVTMPQQAERRLIEEETRKFLAHGREVEKLKTRYHPDRVDLSIANGDESITYEQQKYKESAGRASHQKSQRTAESCIAAYKLNECPAEIERLAKLHGVRGDTIRKYLRVAGYRMPDAPVSRPDRSHETKRGTYKK